MLPGRPRKRVHANLEHNTFEFVGRLAGNLAPPWRVVHVGQVLLIFCTSRFVH